MNTEENSDSEKYFLLENLLSDILNESRKSIISLPEKIVNIFSKNIELTFVEKEEKGNVCFATNNSELRDDFKLVFTSLDIWEYVNGQLLFEPLVKNRKILIPYPHTERDFWQWVSKGKKLRKDFTAKKDNLPLPEWLIKVQNEKLLDEKDFLLAQKIITSSSD
ncbi:MAG: hypothetical protein M9887_01595 [Chitinophagales bacterium]|nr:hypothetical protein [Chitinophagales bacterium]